MRGGGGGGGGTPTLFFRSAINVNWVGRGTCVPSVDLRGDQKKKKKKKKGGLNPLNPPPLRTRLLYLRKIKRRCLLLLLIGRYISVNMACWPESVFNIFGIHNRKHENAIYAVPFLQVSWEWIETWQGYFASENLLKLKVSWGYWHCCLSHVYTLLYIIWKKTDVGVLFRTAKLYTGKKSLKKFMVITNINTREILLHIFLNKCF